jgi:ABC-type transporter Mla subunit MlaD
MHAHIAILVTSSDIWRYALAVFLLLTGIGACFALLRLGTTLGRVSAMLDGVMRELVPLLAKVSTSVDHVNEELDKVGQITDSATDATAKVDATVRSLSEAISKPLRAVAGFTAGISHGFGVFKNKRNQRGGVV